MDTFRLRDGIEVAIRPIRPDDGPLISAAYERPRYERFLVPTRTPTLWMAPVVGGSLSQAGGR